MTVDDAIKTLESVGLTASIEQSKNDSLTVRGFDSTIKGNHQPTLVEPTYISDRFWIRQDNTQWVVIIELGDFDDFQIPATSLLDAVSIVTSRFMKGFAFGQEASISVEDALVELQNCIPSAYHRLRSDGRGYIEGGLETNDEKKPFRFYHGFEISLAGSLYIVGILWFPPTYRRQFWVARTLKDAVQLMCQNWKPPSLP